MDSTVIIITVVLELALYAMFKASSSIILDRQDHLQECKKRQSEARSLGLDPTMWDMGSQKRRNGF